VSLSLALRARYPHYDRQFLYAMCNYFALTSPALLSQLWERREFEVFLAPFSQAWEKGWG
jgi:hypothetical protein